MTDVGKVADQPASEDAEPTIEVTIALRGRAGARQRARPGPVDVGFASERAQGRARGAGDRAAGAQRRRVRRRGGRRGGRRRLVPVEPGMYADDYVEVSGSRPARGHAGGDGRMTVLALDGVRKAYPGGVEALRGVSLRVEQRRAAGGRRALGLGQVDAAAHHGTLERPSSGRLEVAGHDVARARRPASWPACAHGRIGFVFQQFFLLDGHVGARERRHRPAVHGAAVARAASARTGGARAGRPRRTGSTTRRPSCRAASASAWRSPARWSRGRRSCSPTSRPATSTATPAPGSSPCCASSTPRARRSS